MKKVTLYYAPSCVFSAGAVAFVMLRGADVELVNLEEHPDRRAEIARKVPKVETPVFQVGREYHVAPPLSELKELLAQWGLAEQSAPHAKLKSKQTNRPNQPKRMRPTVAA
jgi:glutaredoxin